MTPTSVTLSRPVIFRELAPNDKGVMINREVKLRAGVNDLTGMEPAVVERMLANFVVADAIPKPSAAETPEMLRPTITESPSLTASKPPGVAPVTSQPPGDNFPRNAEGLRTDGPTVAEYVDAGYQAVNYPPGDFASRSTDAEIKAAIDAQAAGGDNGKAGGKGNKA